MVNGWNPEESLLQHLTEHIVRVNVGAQTLLAHLFQLLNNGKICIDIVCCVCCFIMFLVNPIVVHC